MREEILEMRKVLEKDLSHERYEHSIGVSYTCACMAMCHGEDVEKAEIAGLLHDCAKGMKADQLEKLCLAAGIELSEEDKLSPQCYHAFYAPVLAREKYGIKDEYLLNALRWHTTGCKEMTLLDKIVYVADFIEPGRSKRGILSQVRKTAFMDLDRAVYEITEDMILYLKQKDVFIHRKTLECHEWIKQKFAEK